MRSVIYSMAVSLDGYIVGPDGGFGWAAPDEEVFRFSIDEIQGVGVHLMGRRLYETMLYWETADQAPSFNDSEREWTALWNPLPKVVFSTTLTEVRGNARLASGGLAADQGLIDEYRVRVYPVLVGGGVPFYPQHKHQADLELVETRTFSRVVYLHYRVARQTAP
jgi:dihydrofolate reductase